MTTLYFGRVDGLTDAEREQLRDLADVFIRRPTRQRKNITRAM